MNILEIGIEKGREEGRKDGMLDGLKIGRAEGEAKGLAMGKTKGKAESILLLLEDLGPVPDELRKAILEEQNIDILSRYLKLAAHEDSIAYFVDGINHI